MVRQWCPLTRVAALATAALLLAAGNSLAQRGGGHGGGHAGGGHAGGGHAGGFHTGGGHGGGFHAVGAPGGFHHGVAPGGFHHGFAHDGFHHHHNSFFFGLGLGFGGFYPWYYPGYYGGYYPGYYDGWYRAYYPGWYYGDYAPPVYSPGYIASTAVPDTYTNSSSYPSAATAPNAYPEPDENAVYVRVQVPADAEVWFEGQKTTQKGSVRFFESPSLAPGREYVYHIRARWNENGHEVDQTREARVYAGDKFSIDFTKVKNETPPKPRPAG